MGDSLSHLDDLLVRIYASYNASISLAVNGIYI